tara:strand:- start:507 stop:860 length:354 start_codon:yes stop_codon:yes gene_type:complete
MSQKAHKPTAEDRKQVEMLSGLGIPQEQICLLVQGGIDEKTLRKYYADELVSGVAKANSQVSKSLFQKAVSGDTGAQIWWTKTRMGWKDTSRLEHSGPDGAPIEIKRIERVIVDPKD